MKTISKSKTGLKSMPSLRRKSMTASQEDWVKLSPLFEDKHIPTLVSPTIDDLDLVAWGKNNRSYIETLLKEHRALLFRGFNIHDVDPFEAFVLGTSDGSLLEYRDRTTPRHSEGGQSERVYISTVYPSEHSIKPHNEGSYWLKWARKLYFCALVTPDTGGETPIYDVRKVYERIPDSIKAKFEEKKWMLIRNYNDGFGLPWEEVYQTKDPKAVESYCGENNIEFEWQDETRLRTKSVRQAIHQHPDTGEKLWFNHAAFYHHSSLEVEMRKALLAEFALDELPYSSFYGDGTEISAEDIAQINAAYEAEKVAFLWQKGDILLLDNSSIAHGREPYTGDRRIVVGMTEPISDVE